jgi:hypothetical protein
VKRSLKLLPLAAATMFAMTSASATPTVSIDASDGSTASGTATFPALAEESVLGPFADITDFQPTGADDLPPEVVSAMGLKLTDARIAPTETGLRFIWQLDALPAVPPEAVRYTWSFTIGTNVYQLQAKLTNMASTTTVDAPQAHVEQLAAAKPFFQIRGLCTASYMGTPVAGCTHLAFLDGSFDSENARVSIDLPFGTSFAPDVVEGATLLEAQTAGMSITASLQAGVSNTVVSAFVNGWTPYLTAPAVTAAVEASSLDPSTVFYDDAMSLDEDGSWSGAVDGSGGSVYARACHGATCAYDELAL